MAVDLVPTLRGATNVGMEIVAVLPTGEKQNGLPSYYVAAVSADKEHAVTWQCGFIPYLVCAHVDHDKGIFKLPDNAVSCPEHRQRHIETRHYISYFWGHNFVGTKKVNWDEPPTPAEVRQMIREGKKRIPKTLMRITEVTPLQRAMADLARRAGVNPYFMAQMQEG